MLHCPIMASYKFWGIRKVLHPVTVLWPGAWGGRDLHTPANCASAPAEGPTVELFWQCLPGESSRSHRWKAQAHKTVPSPPPFHMLVTSPGCRMTRPTVYRSEVPITPLLQFSSVARSCLTFCDPMDCSMLGSPVLYCLPELAQTHVHWVGDAIQPSHPLSSSPSPTFTLPQHQALFKWVSSSHQVAKVLEFQLQHQSFQWIFRTDFL